LAVKTLVSAARDPLQQVGLPADAVHFSLASR